MTAKLVALFQVFLCSTLALAQPSTDGPYIFYQNNKVIVSSVTHSDNTFISTWDSVGLKKKKRLQPVVHLNGHPEWIFTVKLKSSLEIERSIYPEPLKMLVLSDIEGEFAALRSLLVGNKVIDSLYNWTFGNGQLIICGDLFDRGTEVTAVLWLLYSLEEKAKAKGGYVHVILGNHEIMNLSGDLRYVHPKYIESARLMNRNYNEFFDKNTELGRWLRTKNIIEKIGDGLFMHAGIASEINKRNLTVEQINSMCRPLYDQAQNKDALKQAGASEFFSGSTSPFWYRGYFKELLAPISQIDSTLNLFGCKTIFVGHTIQDNITSWYDGKVIAIDVNHHEGNHQGLLIENGWRYRVDQSGKKYEIGRL